MSAACWRANACLYPFWGNLTAALRTGETQNELSRGESFFAKVYADPQRLAGFLQAKTGVSMGAALMIAERFPWQEHQTFADLGTAHGALPIHVAIARPTSGASISTCLRLRRTSRPTCHYRACRSDSPFRVATSGPVGRDVNLEGSLIWMDVVVPTPHPRHFRRMDLEYPTLEQESSLQLVERDR